MKFTPKRREAFLDCLRETSNITQAAQLIGMSTRQLYNIRDADPEFRQQWQDAVEDGLNSLEGR